MTFITYMVVFLIGASVGSFLGMAAYRLPNHDSLIYPPSHCTSCGSRIRWRDNIPIISWIVLNGRSACCGNGISMRYIVLEMLSGILTLYAFVEFSPVKTIEYIIFIYALILLAEIDVEHMILPDVITKPLILYGLSINSIGQYYGIQVVGMRSSIIGLAVGYLVPWCISGIYSSIRHKRGIGGGDIKLLGAVGSFAGWQAAVVTLYAGAVLGILYSVYLLLKGRSMNTTFPFGPMLAAGAITYMLVL